MSFAGCRLKSWTWILWRCRTWSTQQTEPSWRFWGDQSWQMSPILTYFDPMVWVFLRNQPTWDTLSIVIHGWPLLTISSTHYSPMYSLMKVRNKARCGSGRLGQAPQPGVVWRWHRRPQIICQHRVGQRGDHPQRWRVAHLWQRWWHVVVDSAEDFYLWNSDGICNIM